MLKELCFFMRMGLLKLMKINYFNNIYLAS